tara:strand:+ start:73 stop:288 length:216 start_codon:yes stop_codon:yes gene_type:complete
MKAFSQKYYSHLDEFQQQVNDMWFNKMLTMLSDEGQLYVPDLNKSFNKLGEEIVNSVARDQHYLILKEDIK